MLANVYETGSHLKLVCLFLSDKPFLAKFPLEYFINGIVHSRFAVSSVEFDMIDISIEEKKQHNKKDFGYKAISLDVPGYAYCQYTERKKQSLYELGMIPFNNYDFYWAFEDSDKDKRKYVELNYLIKTLSEHGNTFKPLIAKLKKASI